MSDSHAEMRVCRQEIEAVNDVLDRLFASATLTYPEPTVNGRPEVLVLMDAQLWEDIKDTRHGLGAILFDHALQTGGGQVKGDDNGE